METKTRDRSERTVARRPGDGEVALGGDGDMATIVICGESDYDGKSSSEWTQEMRKSEAVLWPS